VEVQVLSRAQKNGEAGFFDEGEGIEFIQPCEDLNAGALFFHGEK